MISTEQVNDVQQLRASVHALIAKGVTDEFLLATYNGILRRLDERLPKIRERAEGKTLKEESRKVVRQQRDALKRKGAGGAGGAQASTRKAS
jgi:hypothetical protein